MDYSVLKNSALFTGVSEEELHSALEAVPHHIQSFNKGETVFHLMENADRIGIILEGRVQAQKPFPNGSQINVSIRNPGDMIGTAAAFSRMPKYPCDVVSLEPSRIIIFRTEALLLFLQKDVRIMKNFMTEIATAAYMLQQRLELLSYHGITQKAACFLLMQSRQSGKNVVRIPESISNWAMIMNVSRPSLHRELKVLESNGLIRIASHTIEILDHDALQNVLE